MKLFNLIVAVLSVGALSACAGSRSVSTQKESAQVPDVAAALLDVFPASLDLMPEAERGATQTSFAYTPTDSSWGEGLDEQNVFHMEMKHTQDDDNSFALRIGKGGQIYSLRGAFGESVPPSNTRSPWNDEVWQFVAACERYNTLNSLEKAGPVSEATLARFKEVLPAHHYFIHNSGSYIVGESDITNLYCPMLASELSADGRTYRTLNWGLTSLTDTLHRSPLLYYCQTRDLGDGILELTWMVHNFSVRDDVVFGYLNAPWGGTRHTSLPFHYVASPEGEALPREQLIAQQTHFPTTLEFRETGGWKLACATEAADSPALAVVFGRDKNLEAELQKAADGEPFCQFKPSGYRDYLAGWPHYDKGGAWEDWQTRPENSFRNYDVVEAAVRLNLKPGTSIFWRSFLVINRRDKAAELAQSLVDQVDYGLAVFDPATTPMVPVCIRDGKVVDSGRPAFELYSKPVLGTMPVFLIEQAESGREVLTTDPYVFVQKERVELGVPEEHPHYDYYKDATRYSMKKHHSQWKRLLGYAYVDKPAEGAYVKLSSLLEPSQFPEPTTFHLDLWVKRP